MRPPRESEIEIGRASCRGRGEISGGAGSLKKKGGIGDLTVTGVQTCALPISAAEFVHDSVGLAVVPHRDAPPEVVGDRVGGAPLGADFALEAPPVLHPHAHPFVSC